MSTSPGPFDVQTDGTFFAGLCRTLAAIHRLDLIDIEHSPASNDYAVTLRDSVVDFSFQFYVTQRDLLSARANRESFAQWVAECFRRARQAIDDAAVAVAPAGPETTS